MNEEDILYQFILRLLAERDASGWQTMGGPLPYDDYGLQQMIGGVTAVDPNTYLYEDWGDIGVGSAYENTGMADPYSAIGQDAPGAFVYDPNRIAPQAPPNYGYLPPSPGLGVGADTISRMAAQMPWGTAKRDRRPPQAADRTFTDPGRATAEQRRPPQAAQRTFSDPGRATAEQRRPPAQASTPGFSPAQALRSRLPGVATARNRMR
jgi:hypothetical protein